MIDIKKYAEILQDIRGMVNSEITEDQPRIAQIVVSPKEEHLVKKLKDKEGIILCGSFPTCDTTLENSDHIEANNECLIYLLEKVTAGSKTDAQEMDHYAYLQSLMNGVIHVLIENNYSCEHQVEIPKQIRTEWEYNVYGGFNGLSIGFDLKDND